MLTSIETRLATGLRERIEEQMGEYISELDSIDLTGRNPIAQFAEARARYSALEDTLFLIEELTKELSE